MATVLWGSTKAVQGEEGLFRPFVIRNRIDASQSGSAMNQGDTNELVQIKAGWLVKRVWALLRQTSTLVAQSGTTGQYMVFGDSMNTGTWIGTTGLNIGTGGTTTPVDIYGGTGVSGSGLADSNCSTMAGVGKYYAVADYVLGTVLCAGVTGTQFNGILDVFVEAIDTNLYESPAGVSGTSSSYSA